MKIKIQDETQIELSKETRIAFITGAGVSVGSGLPTYYGGNGAYDNLSKKPEDILSIENKRNNPGVIWDEISSIIEIGIEARPCLSHKVIASMQNLVKDSLILTQNVDGLHIKAGSKNVIEIHGKGREVYCTECSKKHPKTILSIDQIDLKNREIGKAPECPSCNEKAIVPNVVMFGELLADSDVFRVYDALESPFDYVFVIGTQKQFPYIDLFIHYALKSNPKCQVIDVNPDEQYSNHDADINLKTTSDEFFGLIGNQLP